MSEERPKVNYCHLIGVENGTKTYSPYLDKGARLWRKRAYRVLQSGVVFMKGSTSYGNLHTTCDPGEQGDQMYKQSQLCCLINLASS